MVLFYSTRFYSNAPVLRAQMLCCATPQQDYDYPALTIDTTFCPNYTHADVTVKSLSWYKSDGEDICGRGWKQPVSPKAANAPATGWKASDLHLQDLGC